MSTSHCTIHHTSITLTPSPIMNISIIIIFIRRFTLLYRTNTTLPLITYPPTPYHLSPPPLITYDTPPYAEYQTAPVPQVPAYQVRQDYVVNESPFGAILETDTTGGGGTITMMVRLIPIMHRCDRPACLLYIWALVCMYQPTQYIVS